MPIYKLRTNAPLPVMTRPTLNAKTPNTLPRPCPYDVATLAALLS